MACSKKRKKHFSAKRLYFFALLFLYSLSTSATVISGTIKDEKGEGLSFASVIVKGTSWGTSANADGFYTIELPDGSYILQAQYIGFKQELWTISISKQKSITHNFTLILQGYNLEEISINAGGENPAYRIIRNAIKRREFHLKQLQSFQSSIYLKGLLRNRNTPDAVMGIKIKDGDKKEMNSSMGLDSAGKGLLYLCEQIADYYTEGSKEKLIIRSVKESGSPNGVGLGSVPPIINFYKNNVNVFSGNEFVSPISNAALNYYEYQLEGNFEENGHKIYKIKVTPKRNFERCFLGEIFIADEEWAIHSLRLVSTKKQGLDFLDTIKTEQLYLPISKDMWVIKNQVFYPTINLFGFDIAGDFVTIYNNQKVNEAIPDSVFNPKIRISYLKDANQKDSAYWAAVRPIKLEEVEFKNYRHRDSIYKIENDPERIDSLRKRANKIKLSEIFILGTSLNSKAYKNSIRFSALLFDVNFNTVEGLNYAPSIVYKHNIDSGKTLSWENNLRYGFTNAHLNAKSMLRFIQKSKTWSKRYWEAAIVGGKYISQFNNTQPVVELANSYATLFRNRNYFKIYERWVYAAMVKRNYGNGLSWLVSGQFEQRMPLENSTNYSFVNSINSTIITDNKGPLGNNISPHIVLIAKATISYQPGVRYIQYPNKKVTLASDAPLFILNMEQGIPNFIKSSSDYTKWDFQIKDAINLSRKGSLEYHATVGGFLNKKNVPLPDMNHLVGNQYLLANTYLGSFQLAPYYLYSNTQNLYGTMHIEYALKGFISNKIPLLKQAHWYFVLGSNTFFVNQNQYYNEVFVGLDNIGFKIFRFFRVDLIRGWDSYQNNYYNLRIGLKTNNFKIGFDRQNKAEIF